MKSNQLVSEMLISTRAHEDLKRPVVFTSGDIGIYYVHTENLLRDGEKWKEHGGSSKAMINHAINRMHESAFGDVINILTEKVRKLSCPEGAGISAISGGQRRDWIFSGPVAKQLHWPHISLYKNGEIELLLPEGYVESSPNLKGMHAIHILDLLRAGESCYSIEGDREKGWIPYLRQEGVEIKNLITVVTRLEGGEQRLNNQGITVNSLAAINEDFLRNNSENKEIAIAYIRDPREWSEDYLRKNGALEFISIFNPETGDIVRAKKFLERYRGVLEESGRLGELDKAVQEKYSKSLAELVGLK